MTTRAAVEVITTAHGQQSTMATRVTSPLLATGQIGIGLRFGFGSTNFVRPNDWEAEDRHSSVLEMASTDREATIRRTLASAKYDVDLHWSAGRLAQTGAHRFELAADSTTIEFVAGFQPLAGLAATSHRPAIPQRRL
ncbi:hypothetical protein [Paenarthrobacter ureafaciens]|uniref:hypothetical protein n=1 Tax=Paenarthrobacter ureafaciens TaxID=37931 RepID=UPI001A9829BD|nr:hypothetical protein [Paenarthrobacter ureafaciens]